MASLRQLGTILSHLEAEFVLRIEPRYLATGTLPGEDYDAQPDLADQYVLIPAEEFPGADACPNGCSPVQIVDLDAPG